MNLNMVRPKNKTEDLLQAITKNFETLIKQTHSKPQETLEFKMVKSRKTFHFIPPLELEEDWMIGLTSLEVYNSLHKITKSNNKLEVYTDTFDEFSFTELKVELEEIPNISDITAYHSQHEI